MKIIRRKEVETQERPFGRSVQKLMGQTFAQARDSVAVYLNFLPKSQLDKHYHAESEEIFIYPQGGSIEVNDEIFELDEWDCVYLAPGDVHGFVGEGKDVMLLALKFPDSPDKIAADK